MPNAWVAVDAGIDPRSWARLLRRAYNRAVSGGGAPTIVRDVVSASWVRSEAAGLDPEERAPIMLERAEACRLFQRHPLAPLLHIVESVLVGVAEYAHQVVAIADRDGTVLWTGGNAETLHAAERIHLKPGALWSEASVGTNALGTSLVLDHPLQIFAAEHFKQTMHGWSSAAAPIHDPETGELLGRRHPLGTRQRRPPARLLARRRERADPRGPPRPRGGAPRRAPQGRVPRARRVRLPGGERRRELHRPRPAGDAARVARAQAAPLRRRRPAGAVGRGGPARAAGRRRRLPGPARARRRRRTCRGPSCTSRCSGASERTSRSTAAASTSRCATARSS